MSFSLQAIFFENFRQLYSVLYRLDLKSDILFSNLYKKVNVE